MVRCTDGQKRPLGDTVLPLQILICQQHATAVLPLLSVSDPNDKRWLEFSTFGVITEQSLVYCLKLLESLQRLQPSQEEVLHLYMLIQTKYTEDVQLVVTYFKDKRVVFVPSPMPRWVKLDTCIWKGSKCLRTTVSLSSLYASVQILFRKRLQVPNATVATYIRELSTLSYDSEALPACKELLTGLNTLIKQGVTDPDLHMLWRKKIFPVRSINKDSAETVLVSADEDDWFIADRANLTKCFAGSVRLLDFDLEGVETLSPLIVRLGLEGKVLSKIVNETTVKEGDCAVDSTTTVDLRRKVRYILALADGAMHDRLHSQLSKLEICAVTKVILQRSIQVNGKIVRGLDDNGPIVLATEDNSLRIYVSVDNLQSGTVPVYDLSAQLSAFCGTSDVDKKALMGFILVMPQLNMIEDMLDCSNLLSASRLRDSDNEEVDHEADYDSDDSVSRTPPPGQLSDRLVITSHNSLEQAPSFEPNLSASQTARFDGHRHPRRRCKGKAALPADASMPGEFFGADTMTAISAAANGFFAKELAVVGLGAARWVSDESHVRDIPKSPGAAAHLSQFSAKAESQRTPDDAPSFLDVSSTSTSGTFDMDVLKSSLMTVSSSPFSGPSHSNLDERHLGLASSRISADMSPTHIGVRSEAEILADLRTGLSGEYFVYQFLGRLAGDGFTEHHWTSSMRQRAGLSVFAGCEGEYADFTFDDPTKTLTRYLLEHGCECAEDWLHAPLTYHIEVKATTGGCNEDFHMSSNQLEMARQWTLPADERPTDVFIVLRVYSVGTSETSLFALVDPWSMWMTHRLHIRFGGPITVKVK
ncbi:hypothetical protein LTR66_010479 [Elasticomyces elasticus]|nr:hypothetical protein LTR66_010479 [Elasticomyces elasticus]